MSEAFEQALLMMDRTAALRIFLESTNQNGPIQALEELITPALESIGQGWERGDIALSQVYMSGRICEDLVNAAIPTGDPGWKEKPRMAIAVFEDYHMLGKRIVYSVLRSSGFNLFDYGQLDLEATLKKVAKDQIEILLLSVLMLPSALRILELRRRLDQAETTVKIVVGGAPFRFDEQLWREVGADAMARNASEIIPILQKLTGGDVL